MKLQELLGEELYSQVQAKLDEVNGKEPDKLKHVRYADLSEGEYVSKARYSGLEADLSGKTSELEKANALIAELKKSAGKDDALQQKISDYEGEIASLKEENQKLKTETALKFALLSAGAVDVDYLMFKAGEQGKLKLDEDGKIKGESELISTLKTQHPAMFQGGPPQGGDGARKVLENPLPGGDHNQTVTKEQFAAMGYNDRLKLKQENPELFKKLSKH